MNRRAVGELADGAVGEFRLEDLRGAGAERGEDEGAIVWSKRALQEISRVTDAVGGGYLVDGATSGGVGVERVFGG